MSATSEDLTTVLSSMCQVEGSNALSDLLGSLYGGNGITLAPASDHAPYFTVSSTAAIHQLNRQIASEIAIFPFTSSQGGFTYAFDAAQGTFVRTTQTLGPLLAEKSSTLGRGKLNFNAAYTFYIFKHFNGESLNNLRVTAQHQPDALGAPNVREGFEADTLLIALDLSIRVPLVSLAFRSSRTATRPPAPARVPLERLERGDFSGVSHGV